MFSISVTLVPATVSAALSFNAHRTLSLPRPILKPHLNSLSVKFNSLVRRCSTSDREEQRWQREEQRWQREEQRWLREEQRWIRDREELLREISDLKLQIQALERRVLSSPSSSGSDAIASLLQAVKEKDLVLESGSSLRRLLLEEEKEEEEGGEVIEHEKEIVVVEEVGSRVEKRRALRIGSEGEEVRQMQEALLKLGFYSGEEDMEFSSFSSDTERAVKTWQASLGAPEDGIMTSELIERLYLEISTNDKGNTNENKISTTVLPKESENGAAVASVKEVPDVQQKVVEKGVKGTEVSHPRVFLLGENRWEEPSRLGPSDGVDRTKHKDGTTKCLQCRGEGRLLCTECDGSGEPNIEPQFSEWVEEGTNCPYCEGLGYTPCDLCGGKIMV